MGLMIKDLRGRTWSLGKSVGLGGFGEIYSAVEVTPNKTSPRSQGQYVVKVEPFNNGPLFVEVNFYLRTCKKDSVVEYIEDKELDHLGVGTRRGWKTQGWNTRKLNRPGLGPPGGCNTRG